MITIHNKQSGLTLGGLMFVLSFIGILVLFVVRAFPLYNEKMQVVAAMKSTVGQPDAAGMSEKELVAAFLKNIEATTNLKRFSERSVKDMAEVVKPEEKGEPEMFRVHFQATNVLYQDLYLMMNFDQKMPLRGNKSGSGE